MGRSGWLAVVSLAASVVAGCEMSSVDPDAQVTVGGTLVDGSGQTLASQDVVLLTEPTASDVLLGLPFGLASLGFACLVEDPPPPCDTRRRATTDPDGSFTFTLTGRETQGTFGEAARMTVSAGSPARDREAAGPATTGAFVVATEQVTLEPLPLVRASPSLSARNGHAAIDWSWQGGTAMRGAPSSAELVFQDGHEPVWVASASPGSPIDLRVLEDVPGAVGVVEHRRAAQGTVDDLTYRSELVPYVTGAGAPVSRGAPCRVVAEDGTSAAVSPCPVTDGDLVEQEGAGLACTDPACDHASGYVVDLGQGRAVQLLVVRGCDRSCPLAVSPDGTTWEPVGELRGRHVAVAREGPPVRFVRVTGDAGVHGLAEVSAWDGPPAASTFEVRTLPTGTAGSGGSSAPGQADPGPPWLWWLAGALVLLTAIGLGVVVGRRSG